MPTNTDSWGIDKAESCLIRSSKPFLSIEADRLKSLSPWLGIQHASNVSLETSIPRNHLNRCLASISIPPSHLGMVKAGIASRPTLHRDKDSMIQSTYYGLGGRGHTEVRVLDPGRSSFSCLSLSFVYSLYNTITGRRKEVAENYLIFLD